MTDWPVRPVKPSEADALARMWHDTWHETHAPIVPAELVALRTMGSFRERTEAALPRMRCAGPKGAPLGLCLVTGNELDQIYVAREGRGTGLARRLMEDGCARIAAAGHRTAWLICAEGNGRAAAFYRHLGWRESGEVTGHVEAEGGRFALPCIRFERDLP